jgi:hypothetical protein
MRESGVCEKEEMEEIENIRAKKIRSLLVRGDFLAPVITI